jgi:hypothetical protein
MPLPRWANVSDLDEQTSRPFEEFGRASNPRSGDWNSQRLEGRTEAGLLGSKE